MEEKLEEVSRKSVISEAASEQPTKKIRIEIPILFANTGSLEASIGKRLKQEMPGSEAPTVWSSIASLNILLHEIQIIVQDTVTVSAVLSNDINENVGKYIEQKFASKGLCKKLKTDLSQDLSKYIPNKVAAECSDINTKMKKLKGDVHATVEEIGRYFQNESQRSKDLRMRLV
jgi:hypothetical protein